MEGKGIRALNLSEVKFAILDEMFVLLNIYLERFRKMLMMSFKMKMQVLLAVDEDFISPAPHRIIVSARNANQLVRELEVDISMGVTNLGRRDLWQASRS
nr:hypothetical protein [Tanacetum cinerariifolium]